MRIQKTDKHGNVTRAYSKRFPDYSSLRMAFWQRNNHPRREHSIFDWREGEYGIYEGYGSCCMYKTPPVTERFVDSVLSDFKAMSPECSDEDE